MVSRIIYRTVGVLFMTACICVASGACLWVCDVEIKWVYQLLTCCFLSSLAISAGLLFCGMVFEI